MTFATIVAADGLEPALVLQTEVTKRARVVWPIESQNPGGAAVFLSINPSVSKGRPEGYELSTDLSSSTVTITGVDKRGLLFGVGRFLRIMEATFVESYHIPPTSSVLVPGGMAIATAPRYAIRGHQLGYRPKTNSYDGWTPAQMEQYAVDLSFFGTNTIEIISPESDDVDYSPHFTVPKLDMMIAMSSTLARLDMNCNIWFPALLTNYYNPAVLAQAEAAWRQVFSVMERIDQVMVPAGDPGSLPPDELFYVLAQQRAVLREYHPTATMWVSPQMLNATNIEKFYALLRDPVAGAAVDGVVAAPWVRQDVPTERANTPSRLPMRMYPDITHSMAAQYAVPNWDSAYGYTEGRETINAQPLRHYGIATRYINYTVGFSGYSEGCNDDVNKVTWSSAVWGPDDGAPAGPPHVTQIISDYARVFIGPRLAAQFASLVFGVEQDWTGPILQNAAIPQTTALAEEIEALMVPSDVANWRLQQILYRAHYDAWIRERVLTEGAGEAAAMSALATAHSVGSLAAIAAAAAALNVQLNATAWHHAQRLESLAEGLFQTIRMQLSVPRYAAIGTERGANLDTIDLPITNAPYLRQQFGVIQAMPSESQRLAAIDVLVNWTNPGPGGFYDDLGSITNQQHLVMGPGPTLDPDYFHTPVVTVVTVKGTNYAYPPAYMPPPSLPLLPLAWSRYANMRWTGVLQLLYPALPAGRNYSVTIVYAGSEVGQGGGRSQIMLTANGYQVHPFMSRPEPMRRVTFPIPGAATTQGGDLLLACTQGYPPGVPTSGHDACSIAEILLQPVTQ